MHTLGCLMDNVIARDGCVVKIYRGGEVSVGCARVTCAATSFMICKSLLIFC